MVNDVPVVSSVSIAPYTIQTDSTLSLNVSVEDADPDSIALNISWYVNGALVSTSQQLEGLAFFDRGDVIVASVQPDDGYALGSTVSSQSVTVTNADPSDLSVQVNPTTQRRVIDDLICEVEQYPTDPDGDALQLSFSWSVDGVATANTQSTTYTVDTISASVTVRWVEWTCEATADDGQGKLHHQQHHHRNARLYAANWNRKFHSCFWTSLEQSPAGAPTISHRLAPSHQECSQS